MNHQLEEKGWASEFQLLKAKLPFEWNGVRRAVDRGFACLRWAAQVKLGESEPDEGAGFGYSKRVLANAPKGNLVGVNQFHEGREICLLEHTCTTR